MICVTILFTPSVSKYKQNSVFRFILMIYVIHIMNHFFGREYDLVTLP